MEQKAWRKANESVIVDSTNWLQLEGLFNPILPWLFFYFILQVEREGQICPLYEHTGMVQLVFVDCMFLNFSNLNILK